MDGLDPPATEPGDRTTRALRVHTLTSAPDFLRLAESFLLLDEARHNLILSLAERLASDPGAWGPAPYLAVIESEGQVVLAALRTPPNSLVLSSVADPNALRALAADVYGLMPDLPGVSSTGGDAGEFAREWRHLSGRVGRIRRRERIYQLDRVAAVPASAGDMREATPEDRTLLVDWLHSFESEVHGAPTDGDEVERAVDSRLGNHSTNTTGYFIWEYEGPVAMAGLGGSTPNGVRVGPVWTPVEHRRNGYATALVAHMSQLALDRGRRFCFLYADQSNPTSNSIYQRMGYRPVCDAENWVFESS